MNVFELRDQLITDYSSFITSFIKIRDRRTADYVNEQFRAGVLWPEPLVQLNPCFEPGEQIEELVKQGILQEECADIFKIKSESGDESRSFKLHRHQSEAVKIAAGGNNYVLTTGTGSGKSLAYIIPIVDHVLRNGSGKGIQAIIVYPMNALANSQVGELEKFLCRGYPDSRGPVTFKRYTGQESDEEKKRIIAEPPDILLTNYVMLELVLTRPQEKNLINAARNLRFLVLDELHTYRGRQGADVAMLVRRTREALGADSLLCVGTSATLAGGGTWPEQQIEVAEVASRLFGSEVKPGHIIGESLKRVTTEEDSTSEEFVPRLAKRLKDSQKGPSTDFDEFRTDPLSIWLESTLGISREQNSGRLIRQTPRSITGERGISGELSKLTNIPESQCAKAIQDTLLAGYNCSHPDTGLPVFAFRVHQFISRGDTVYASLESESERHLTLRAQQYVPDDRSRVLLPMVFCRGCGQEYYCVWRGSDENGYHYKSRDFSDRTGEEDSEAGFLYASTESPWLSDGEELPARLPDDWLDERGAVRPNRRKNLPEPVTVEKNGSDGASGLSCSYIQAPFRFCLRCGVSYGFRQRSDFHKLAALGSEGRSTATTILSLSAIRNLRQMPLEITARKLLSFTDNRQDASLQAGHFNDFVEVGLLRSTLYRAVRDAGDGGLRHDELAQNVFKALGLPIELYAENPELRGLAREETDRALRDVLGYRLYRDLQRGWRIMAPNLEQVGLLQIDYPYLSEACRDDTLWADCHPALSNSSAETRAKVAKDLLDLMRREMVIKVEYLKSSYQERLLQRSQQRLIPPWGFDENDQIRDLLQAGVLYPRARRQRDYGGNIYLSPRSGFGQYLRRSSTFGDYKERISLEETERILRESLDRLKNYGLVEIVDEPQNDSQVPGYQLTAGAMVWRAADGTKGYYDPIRQPTETQEGSRPNSFFVNYYRSVAEKTLGIEAREHTAQVPYEQRENREQRFRDGTLPILFCSPTMELGIDIAQLNAVNL
ncbi:MAG: DEAD/DEAH box helicase, partial [Desulfobacteraceae bacterium]|nr:DEAD/DEAH box helicase [Desulfobacteraceae bacterium]